MRPASMTRISSPHSRAVQFIPISPMPPRGMMERLAGFACSLMVGCSSDTADAPLVDQAPQNSATKPILQPETGAASGLLLRSAYALYPHLVELGLLFPDMVADVLPGDQHPEILWH